MTVTIKDLAEHLNLAVSTVSKALNDYEDISKQTKVRVLEAAERLGYHPSEAALSLRRKRTNRIGFIVYTAYTSFRYVSAFYFEMLRGAAHAAETVDYNLVIYTTLTGQLDRLYRICRSREVDGIILMAGGRNVAQPVSLLLKHNIPFVVLHERVDELGVSYVAPDNIHGAYLATSHLVELGHRRIAYLGRVFNDLENVDRQTGYRQALEESGIPFEEELTKNVSLDPEETREAVHRFLDLPSPATALFAFNDARAIVALQALAERRLRVPDEFAVIGFDDVPAAATSVPPLSTVRQPLVEMGSTAIEALFEQMFEHSTEPIRKIVPVELVVRGSSDP